MKILITGVAGLIGSKFADWLIEKYPNYQLHGIDNLSGGCFDHINSKVIFHKIDLLEYNKVEKIFDENKFDLIFHFAYLCKQKD